MKREYCPQHGHIIATATATLPPAVSEIKTTPHPALQQKTLSAPSDTLYLEIPAFIRLITQATRTLTNIKAHPAGTCAVGVPAHLVNLVQIYLLRIEPRQKHLLDVDLQTEAKREIKASQQLRDQFIADIGRLRRGELTAEMLAKCITNQPNVNMARSMFNTLASTDSRITIDKRVWSEAGSGDKNRFAKSEQTYTLRLQVNALSEKVDLQVSSKPSQCPILEVTSSEHPRIVASFIGKDIRVALGQCWTYGLEVEAEMALTVEITKLGYSFTGKVIRITNQPEINAAMLKQLQQQNLFPESSPNIK